MRIVKPCRPSAATDGRGEARTPAGPDNEPPHRSWGADGVPFRAIARQQAQQRRNAEIRSMPGDQRVQAIPAGPVARPAVWAATSARDIEPEDMRG